MSLLQQIKQQAEDIFEEVLEKRRHIHSHPELSFHEKETAAYVQAELGKMGIPFTRDVGGHGVVGIIEGKREGEGKTLALRADMDALPIKEANDVSYKSKNPGVMHACGHDVHTSSLLGTARILNGLSEQFSGKVKLIFQPAEERFPGGASIMIKEGVLQNPSVQAILGQHVQPFIDQGKIGVRPGKYMASADEIYIRIKGKGGHAAIPSKFIDPVMIAVQVLSTLQQVVSRSNPRIPSVLSFGKVIAEGATNVIPDEVYIEGTFRTMNETWRMEAHEKIKSIIQHTTAALGGTAEIDLRKGYPVLFNDEKLTMSSRGYIADYVGEENIVDMDLWMAAEDFAYYTHEVPGCFYRLGTRNEAKGIVHGLHTPLFDIDEDALRTSTGLMAWLAIKQLESVI
ncbi:MAG: M20 family metallopeptidase [Bacteroidia bacterium]|nr:M20 family metallopeptidase [Bacteroidia bacterium]